MCQKEGKCDEPSLGDDIGILQVFSMYDYSLVGIFGEVRYLCPLLKHGKRIIGRRFWDIVLATFLLIKVG